MYDLRMYLLKKSEATCYNANKTRLTRNISARTKVMARRNFQESIIVSIYKMCLKQSENKRRVPRRSFV